MRATDSRSFSVRWAARLVVISLAWVVLGGLTLLFLFVVGAR